MLHPDLMVGESRHGRGIFAARDLPTGTVVWLPCERCSIWPRAALGELPTERFQELDELGFYLSDGGIVMPCSGAALFNHSCDAAVLDHGLDFGIAVRDLRAGEEVRVDYRTFSDDAAWTMECGCGAPECARRIGPEQGLDSEVRERWRGHITLALRELKRLPQALHGELVRSSAVYEQWRSLGEGLEEKCVASVSVRMPARERDALVCGKGGAA